MRWKETSCQEWAIADWRLFCKFWVLECTMAHPLRHGLLFQWPILRSQPANTCLNMELRGQCSSAFWHDLRTLPKVNQVFANSNFSSIVFNTNNPPVSIHYMFWMNAKITNNYIEQSNIPQHTVSVSSSSFGIPPPCCNEYMAGLQLANISAIVLLCGASSHRLPNSNVVNLVEWVTSTTQIFTWQYQIIDKKGTRKIVANLNW